MSTCPPLKPIGALNIKKGWSHKREIEVKYLGFVLNLNFKSHDKWIQMLPANLNFLKMIVEQFDIWPVLRKLVNLQMGSPLSSHAVELWWFLQPTAGEKPPNSILGSVLQSEFKSFSSTWRRFAVICAGKVSVLMQRWMETYLG